MTVLYNIYVNQKTNSIAIAIYVYTFMKSEKALDDTTAWIQHKWIHVHMATYFRARCRAVSPSLLTTLGLVSFPFTRVCTTSRCPFLMRSTKVMMVITL